MHISLDAFWPSASNGKSVSKHKHIYDFIQFMCMCILCRYIRMLTVINWWVYYLLFLMSSFLQRIFISSYRPSSNYWTLQDLIFISLIQWLKKTRQLENRNPVTHTCIQFTHILCIFEYACIGHTRSPPCLSQQCVRYYHHTFEYYRKVP